LKVLRTMSVYALYVDIYVKKSYYFCKLQYLRREIYFCRIWLTHLRLKIAYVMHCKYNMTMLKRG